MRKIILILVFLLLPIPLFGQSSWREKNSSREDQAYKSIQVFETDFSDKPFIVLGKIHVESVNPKNLSDKTRKKAKKYGGDAVLMYKVLKIGSMSIWWGRTASYAEGVLIKFDEKGITKITEQTPIPVLE